MTGNQQRRLDKYEREMAFMTDNAADFPPTSPGGKQVAGQTPDIARIKALAAEQLTGKGGSRMQTGLKDDYLDEITELLRVVHRAANGMDDEIPGIDDMFRLPRSLSEQNLFAAARAFVRDAKPHLKIFADYDVPDTVFNRLTELVDLAESAATSGDSSKEQSSGATGEMKALFSQCGKRSGTLDGIVKNKYRNDPGKLAAWTVASHLEKAPAAK